MAELDTKKQLDIFHKIISRILMIKSEHTARHINQVPILAEMIAKAWNKAEAADFSDSDIYNIAMAAKLHDCGKVATPDYLLEKSCKLEFVYNRIHEIRNRFEILRRDAQIRYLKQILANPKNKKQAQKKLKTEIAKLEDDFRFIAECNCGHISMSPANIKKLQRIGKRKFKRWFNRMLGISWIEKAQYDEKTLACYTHPAQENLLQQDIGTYQGIPLDEIYNLSTPWGTINALERKKIEEHAAHTAELLALLELPKEYKAIIPDAANHHERLDGSGYPRKLKEKDISVSAQIIMLADIFEALTSSDRPYKTPKRLSEALHILQTMKNKGQLSEKIYHIFLKQKIFLKYAQKHLSPEQIDVTDIKDYL